MRLMDRIIAALLTICMAVFPIAMPQAVAWAGHSQAEAHAGHVADVSDPRRHDAVSDTAGHEHASHHGETDDGQSCCGTVTCHAFQVSGAPSVATQLRLVGVVEIFADPQVAEVVSGRLDRPPRTV